MCNMNICCTKMADKEEALERKGSFLTQASETELAKEENQSDLEQRYSVEECDEIGKMVMNTIQSELELYFCELNVEKVEDPHIKAWKYLEQARALETLQRLLSKLVYKRPKEPLQYMIDEVKKIMKEKGLKIPEDENENDENPCTNENEPTGTLPQAILSKAGENAPRNANKGGLGVPGTTEEAVQKVMENIQKNEYSPAHKQ